MARLAWPDTLSLFPFQARSVDMTQLTLNWPTHLRPTKSVLPIQADLIPHECLDSSASESWPSRPIYQPSHTRHENRCYPINSETYAPNEILSLIHDISRILPLIHALIRSPTIIVSDLIYTPSLYSVGYDIPSLNTSLPSSKQEQYMRKKMYIKSNVYSWIPIFCNELWYWHLKVDFHH